MPVLRVTVAAALVAAATVLGVPAQPAVAAACTTSAGVTVVVDFHQLGGGAQIECDPSGGGKTASSLFIDNRFSLTYIASGGVVCRINGLPAGEDCSDMPPADAYWALYWSNGKSGGWTYSSLGVDGLKIPPGGSVAFSWSKGGTTRPSVAPPVIAAAESPTPQAEPTTASGVEGSGKGDKKPGKGETRKPFPTPKPTVPPATPSPTAATTPTASASSTPGKPARTRSSTPSATPSATPVASPTEAPVTAAPIPSASPEGAGDPVTPTAAETDDGGVPGWLPPALIALLAAVAGAVAWARRRAA